jgi:hypothetical protein
MKLKECPFCGAHGDLIDIFETSSGIAGLRGEYYVMCCVCFAESGKEVTRAKAAKLWNRRKSPVTRRPHV